MHRHFSLDMPAGRFARNAALASLAALLPLLALYVAVTPGFWAALSAGGPAAGRFLWQVATTGLPIVLVVNAIGFLLFAWLGERQPGDRAAALVLALDMPVRIAAFVGMHALVYALAADRVGAFGGSPATALRVVAPTLARSALFENISGVYLYATLVSAMPLYAAAIARSPRLGPLARRVPARSGPLLLALALFVAFVVALTALARALVALQPG